MLKEKEATELGLPEDERPPCEFGNLRGPDGNTFAIMGYAAQSLKSIKRRDKASEMTQRVTSGEAESYQHALRIILEYVEDTYGVLEEELEKDEDMGAE